MVKLLLSLLIVFAVFAMLIILKKIKINQSFKKSQFAKTAFKKPAVTALDQREEYEIIEEVSLSEQQLFDDVAQLFLASKQHEMSKDHAVNIQSDVLKKMPIQTKSIIRDLDLGEWSIYWGFYQQSLEYYVGKYGVFMTHVDREGKEHQYRHPLENR